MKTETASTERLFPAQKKPYYAVVFSSHRNRNDPEGYEEAAQKMLALASAQPGYLGMESVRETDGFGITVSYWDSLESIQAWKAQADHKEAQRQGKSSWYSAFTTRVCRVERDYDFSNPNQKPNNLPQLSTDRLSIKHLGECTAAQVIQYFDRNKVHLAPTDPPHPIGFFTLDYWENRIKNSIHECHMGSAIRFVLINKSENEMIGTINLTQIFRGPFQACYLGYAIDHRYEGKGLMYEALQEVIRYAFNTLNLHRIMANHLPENIRSAKLLQRLGFQTEGIAKNYLMINGAWRDYVLNSLTHQTWSPGN